MKTAMLRGDCWYCLCVLALGTFFANSLQAQRLQPQNLRAHKKVVLEEVVVVANKVPRSIHSIAANVSVISKQDIQESLSTSVSDVFQYTPGIDTETSGVRFGAESINIRGIGGNRVAIIIDGVPISDQFDIGNFSNATRDFVNAGLIQRAEILHGSASTLYGSDAIGGVVAMYTPDPQDIQKGNKTGGEVLTTYRDANDSAHIQALFASGSTELSFLGAASWRDGHEFEPIETTDNPDLRDHKRKSVLLKAVADNYAGHSWRFEYIHQQSDTQSELHSMLGSGRFRSTTRLQGDDESSMDLGMLEYNINALQPWFDSSILRAYHLQTDVNQTTLDEREKARTPVSIDRLFSYQQNTTGLELNLQKHFSTGAVRHQFGFGLEYKHKTTDEFRDGAQTVLATGVTSNTVLGETFPVQDFPGSATDKLGAYLEYTLSKERWTLIAALRGDRYILDARPDAEFLQDNPQTKVVSLSESDISPKLGLIFNLNANTDLYLQYAHGFRAPPFEDANIGLDIPLFNIRAIPNPDLRSESSNGVDIGCRWYREMSKFHIGYFRTGYDDFIETKVRLGMDPLSGRLLFQSRNISSAVISGLEAGWHFDLPHNFVISGSAYIADGSNQDSDQPLNSVGPEQLVLGAGWSSADGGRAIRLRGTYTAKWNDRDLSGGELFVPDSYTLFDLYYTEKLTSNLMLRAGLQNLTDQKYWIWSDVRGIGPEDPLLAVVARPGRQFSLSLNFNW